MPQKVMIVEDNVLNMRLFNDVIESRGYEVIQSVDGVDVIPLAHEHSPDLIIMDIQLPVFSGVEITHNLKQDPQLETIPVVAVTAFARYGDREKFLSEGFAAYLSKPVPIHVLLDTIDQIIGMSSVSDAAKTDGASHESASSMADGIALKVVSTKSA